MNKIIAVDFDGTLCEDKWPEIGFPRLKVIRKVILEKNNGSKLILWTCREGKLLEEAVEWCKKFGIEFDAINVNFPEAIKHWNSNPRKIGADEYLDDKAVKV